MKYHNPTTKEEIKSNAIHYKVFFSKNKKIITVKVQDLSTFKPTIKEEIIYLLVSPFWDLYSYYLSIPIAFNIV
jgi:hypothetical protein